MHCQKRIHLGLLSKDESWTLFQKHANIDNAFSESLMDVPLKLCDECNGLLIAIVVLGSSLKGKSKDDWEVALQNSRHSESIDDHESVQTTLSCLKLSYDYLKNKDAELLFLMCSMFPEDYEISIECLIRYAAGMGWEGSFSLDSRRSRIRAGINKLLDSSLLFHVVANKLSSDIHDVERVKMHDMVRDAALWIARRLNRKILVNLDKPLSILEEDYSMRDYFAVSSWYEENQISLQWDAPNLEILLLHTAIDTWDSLNLSHATFEGVKRLKVFSIIGNTEFPKPSLSLPQSTQLLTNLRTLRLNEWHLGDIAFITSLTTLEVLDLEHCSFNELPNEIGKLNKLRLLDLSSCSILFENYNGATGKCSRLEELYAYGCQPGEYLAQGIVDIVTHPKLQRFVIHTYKCKFSFGSDMDAYFRSATRFHFYYVGGATRFLSLDCFNIWCLETSKKNLLQLAEIVYLLHLRGGCRSVIPDMIGFVGAMNSLSCLTLDDCEEIEYIFDTTSDPNYVASDALIPKLVKLELFNLKNLKKVFRGRPLQALSFFQKLEELYISECPKLLSIFPWHCNLQNLEILKIEQSFTGEVLFSISIAQSLHQLKVLSIEHCYELKHIVASGNEEIVSAPTNSHFMMLMPNLEALYVLHCPKLESLFPISFIEELARLQVMKIIHARKLKYIFGECDQKDSSHQYCNQIMLPHFELLFLVHLENLIGIYPENYHAKWPSQTNLTVSNWPKLTPMWIVVIKAQQLTVANLPQLNLISWVDPTPGQILSFQCLQHLLVSECENLKSLFSMMVHTSLPKLTSLAIYDCHELEHVIADNKKLEHLSNAELFFPKLTDVTVGNCNKLKSLFSISMVRMVPQLSILAISEATQLEEVFRCGNEDDFINEKKIVLQNLREIQLKMLPSFVDICNGYKLLAVKLEELQIDE